MNAFAIFKSQEDLGVDNRASDSSTKIVKKCVRKGEILRYTRKENINMLNTISDREMKQKGDLNSKKESEGSSSEQLSGESAYKTYIFEETENNDIEIEKCIAFWKSVMERNLKPIKCTLINNKKRQENKLNLESPEVYSNNGNVDAVVERTTEAIHAEYKKMWLKTVNDIQNLKLESVKLIGKARCKLCEALEKPLEEYDTEQGSETIRKEVESLNTWKSISRRKRMNAKERSKIKKIDDTKEKLLPSEDISKPNIDDTGETLLPSEDICKLKMDETAKYKFVNVIEMKKRDGIYSKWRDNLVKTVCPCGKLKCDCNTNPAIKSINVIQGAVCENAVKDVSGELQTEASDKVFKSSERNFEAFENVSKSEQIFMGMDDSYNQSFMYPYFDNTQQTTREMTQEEINMSTSLQETDRQETIMPIREFAREEMKISTSLVQTNTQITILPTREFAEEEIKISTSLQQTDTQATTLPTKELISEEINISTPLGQTDIQATILPTRELAEEEIHLSTSLQEIDMRATIIPTREFAQEEIHLSTSLQEIDMRATIIPTREFAQEEIRLFTTLQQTDTQVTPTQDFIQDEIDEDEIDEDEIDEDEIDEDKIKKPAEEIEDIECPDITIKSVSEQSRDSTINSECKFLSFGMERTVSVILPTGEVEIIQRENVDDTTWNKPIFPKLAVSLDSARCSLEAMRKKLGRRGPKNSKNQITSELEVKSANDIHNKPSIRKPILKNSSASSAKIPLHDSTQLEVLHHKSSNPYDVSTVFMIQQ